MSGRHRAAAMIALAGVLQRERRPADAALLLRQAVAWAPEEAAAHHHLALVLRPVAETALVERLLLRTVRCAPGEAEALANLALVRSEARRHEEAAATARRAVALNPAYGNAYNNHGRSLKERGRPEEAAACFGRAATLSPLAAMGWINRGDALMEAGRLDEARDCWRAAIVAEPGAAAAYNNLGHLRYGRGESGADQALRRAIRLRPDYAAAHLNLGMALLRAGDFAEGWREYEWWRRTVPLPSGWSGAPEGRWNGQDLTGRTLLLRGEQGLGDVLQFVRYAGLFARLGARVMIEVPPPLRRLLATVPGVARCLAAGETPPPFDFHLPLMSAPGLLGTRLDTIPADIPYLAADPALTAAWRERLSGLAGMKVGLVWAGNPRPDNPDAHNVDRRRSVDPVRLRPLLERPGVSFVSLQKGEAAAGIGALPPELRPFDAMDEIEDFADTAALVAALDLVITVDTSVAHLAGALGIPVWILSRHDGCWRWLADRDDSPWYPTAHLFRQRAPGDWDEVVERVGAALERALPRPSLRARDIPAR